MIDNLFTLPSGVLVKAPDDRYSRSKPDGPGYRRGPRHGVPPVQGTLSARAVLLAYVARILASELPASTAAGAAITTGGG